MKNSNVKNTSRRNFLKIAGATGLIIPFASPFSSLTAAGLLNQRNPLTFPTLDRGVRKGNQVSFNLAIDIAKTEFFKGIQTNTLGIK